MTFLALSPEYACYTVLSRRSWAYAAAGVPSSIHDTIWHSPQPDAAILFPAGGLLEFHEAVLGKDAL